MSHFSLFSRSFSPDSESLNLNIFAIWIARHLSIPSGPGSFPFNRSSLNVLLSHIMSSKKKPGSIFKTWLKNLRCPNSFFTSSAFHTIEGHNSAKFSASRMIRILFLQIPVMSFSLYPEILPAASLTSTSTTISPASTHILIPIPLPYFKDFLWWHPTFMYQNLYSFSLAA